MSNEQQSTIDEQPIESRETQPVHHEGISDGIRPWMYVAFAVALIVVRLASNSAAFSSEEGKGPVQSANEASTQIMQESTSRAAEVLDPTGLYTYQNADGETRLRVYGTRWFATTVIRTGFGSDYDASQAMTSSGVVADNVLYDETGYVEVGSLRRIGATEWTAVLTVGGGYMRLRKE